MKLKKHYFLMLSCPGDVIRERELLKECIEIVNNERNDDSWVELKYWLTDTFSEAGTPAQESINKQIVDESDGLIAIFNARLGTPVHTYPCGTAEEIALMLAANKHVSLLFNTAPRIDLTQSNSIDQITKLKEYKEQQSQNSFYKEFRDEESFKTTALQEIRLWLRSFNKSNDTDAVGNENVVVGKEPIETESQNVLVTDVVNNENESFINDNIVELSEEGLLDCVLYITNSSDELKILFDQYGETVQSFQIKVDEFVHKFTYMSKQNNTGGSLMLCKGFAKEADEWGNKLNQLNNDFMSKWQSIFTYMKILPREMISKDDKIIMKSSCLTLRDQFSYMMEKTNELLQIFNKIPNIQKDFNISMKSIKSVFIKFYQFLETAKINCDELENIFI